VNNEDFVTKLLSNTEELLRRNEERLQTILKAIPDRMYLIDKEGFFLDQYHGETNFSNFPNGPVLGLNISDVLPTQLAFNYISEINKCLSTQQVRKVEYSLFLDGQKRCFESRIVPATAYEVLTLEIEVTSRKNAERIKEATYRISQLALESYSLDRLNESIHVIIATLMDAENLQIALYDPETDILNYPYFKDVRESIPEPAKPGKGLTEYVLRTGRPLLVNMQNIEEMVEQGEVIITNNFSCSAWIGVPLKTKTRIIGVLTVSHYNDAVSFTEADKDILTFVSEQVAMAIESIQKEEELRKAKNTAEASSRIKSALLTNMSHEFRTPMNGILNYAGLLKDKLNDIGLNSMANFILHSGTRLMSTLDSIMYLAQIESSSINLDFKKLDISRTINSVIESYEQDARNKQLNYQTYLTAGVYAEFDEILMLQICKYLLDNAIKFTTSGFVSVHVHALHENEKAYAEIVISDTGIGISKEHQELIFQEFRQVSYGYGRSHEGFGLGLTLARKMTELMKGKIRVESEPGKGSKFFIRFALAENDKKEGLNEITKVPVSAEIAMNEAAVINKTPEVLIVEDNQVNMELTVMFLKGVCKTDRAKDALTAIKLASSKQYDAILMDINLGPGMNGLEAATEIRKIPGYGEIPIVAVTGYTMSGDRERMLQGGCSDYLPKPFDKKSIVGKVKEVLHLA
jgi:signal transduction histidine kinase/PAS domain-containing protein